MPVFGSHNRLHQYRRDVRESHGPPLHTVFVREIADQLRLHQRALMRAIVGHRADPGNCAAGERNLDRFRNEVGTWAGGDLNGSRTLPNVAAALIVRGLTVAAALQDSDKVRRGETVTQADHAWGGVYFDSRLIGVMLDLLDPVGVPDRGGSESYDEYKEEPGDNRSRWMLAGAQKDFEE